jgi:cyclic di-GMP phosphodiesterase Gmr
MGTVLEQMSGARNRLALAPLEGFARNPAYDNDGAESLLYAVFGTTTPYWYFSDDSNALKLAAHGHPTQIAVPLTRAEAECIRSFTGVTGHTVIETKIDGEPIRLSLVGRKVDRRNWSGTAACFTDTTSVASTLEHGLYFAEQVVSEVNSLVVIIDSNLKIKRFNRLCEELSGLREENLIGMSAHELFMIGPEKDISSSNIQEFFSNGFSYEAERTVNTIHGPRTILWRNKFVQSGSGADERYLICSGIDVTEERKAQAKLVELANFDSLTGLPNRHAIHERIKATIEAERLFGVLFLDLDNFKKINDHYGHVTGDKLIQQVARAISDCLRPVDVAARLGGDEFLILVENADEEAMRRVASRIIDRLKKPFHVGLVQIYTGCSIGMALCPQHGATLEDLVRNADTAMYVAKEAGRGTFRIYAQEMNSKVAQYMWLETNLRNALDGGELRLYYQPKFSLKTGELRGVEALLRWNSSERGQISPMEFIPYAEESGLILPLGRWVLHEAARQAATWRRKGIDLRIAVNVSARQLVNSDIVDQFASAVAAAGLEDCPLDIELTESCVAEDEEVAVGLITRLRQMGAKVHLDDFGTGFSSLSQLARLPLDTIKLDRAFVTSIDSNNRSQALVRSMVAVAQELELDVIAEGVETHEEAAFLRSVGVAHVQGFLYAKPMSSENLEAWYEAKTAAASESRVTA